MFARAWHDTFWRLPFHSSQLFVHSYLLPWSVGCGCGCGCGCGREGVGVGGWEGVDGWVGGREGVGGCMIGLL